VEELINSVWHLEAVVAEEAVEEAAAVEKRQLLRLWRLLKKKRHPLPLIW
jgi:hypothetical protein